MEENKRIIHTSLRYAIKRSLIHVPPISISLLLIALNLEGIHLGQELGNENWHTTYTLAALQVAAKFQASSSRHPACRAIFEAAC